MNLDNVKPKIIEGLEFRGLFAVILHDVEFRLEPSIWGPREQPHTECIVTIRVPSVVDGRLTSVRNGVLFCAEDIRLDEKPFTPRQNMLRWTLREIWHHEWEESIFLNGKQLVNPHP